jgi:dTDP-glucose 4,6-dehydratase
MKNGRKGETYNIGGNNEVENISLAEKLCDIMDEKYRSKRLKSFRELITFVKDRPGHDRRYAIDSSKVEQELGWVPEESFETGLEKTVRWYIDNSEWVERVRSGEYLSWVKEHYG